MARICDVNKWKESAVVEAFWASVGHQADAEMAGQWTFFSKDKTSLRTCERARRISGRASWVQVRPGHRSTQNAE
jgi:hypothetical protein